MIEQSMINGLVAGSIYALVALGFGLVFQACRFFHFAHGAVYATAPYLAYSFIYFGGWSLWAAAPLAILGSAILGSSIEVLVYRPMRMAGASSIVLLLASLGILIAGQNCISLIFGDETRILRSSIVVEGLNISGARITVVQIVIVVTSIFLSIGLWLWLQKSKSGMILRAVANDSELTSVLGLNSDRIIVVAFALGSALAGVAAIFIAYETDLTPMMGFRAILMGVVAVIVGGIGSVPGALVGGLFVGLAQHIGVWKLPTQWQDAIVFVILILFLLLRPQGFMGKPVRKTAI